jgi:hypothetical protein
MAVSDRVLIRFDTGRKQVLSLRECSPVPREIIPSGDSLDNPGFGVILLEPMHSER